MHQVRALTPLCKDFFFTINSCFSVYQIIRQKILDLLNPLTGHLGVQLIAAVATVWSRKQARRHSKTKVRVERAWRLHPVTAAVETNCPHAWHLAHPHVCAH